MAKHKILAMLSIIFILNLWAHEELTTMNCGKLEQQIRILAMGKKGYQITTPDKQKRVLPSPEVKDQFDPQKKQLFDTYTFKSANFKLVIKRPETKGTIKNTFALWNDKKFDCF